MFFEDCFAGQHWDIAPFALEKDEIIEFSQRYDPMPFHLDETFAATSRFGGLIASGHLTFLKAWSSFSRAHPEHQEGMIAGAELTENWLAPVYAGDVLSGQVRVTGVQQRNRYNGVVFTEIEITNQGQASVLKARAQIIFALRHPAEISEV